VIARDRKLICELVRDLIADIRVCEERDKDQPEMLAYARVCRANVSLLFRERHRARLDRYGWPSEIIPTRYAGEAAALMDPRSRPRP
jgi:hypothetical protein